MKNGRNNAINNTLFKAALIIVICYAAETGIMHLLARFNLENSAIAPVLDSLTLILVMTPLIYLLFVKSIKRDLEEKKALSASLEKMNRTLLTVSNCNQALVRATDGQQLMDDVCRVLTETGGYRMAWIGLAEHDAEKTVRPAAYSGHNEGYLETLKITWADTERGRGPTGTAIRANKPVVCHDIATGPLFDAWRSEAQKRGYISSAAIPLTDGNAVIGSLNIYSGKAAAFDADEMRLLTELAADLSFGIRHQRIKNELEASEKKFRGLADNALVGIIQSALDGGILYANNTLLEIFEFDSLEEFISAGALQRWKNPEARKKMVEQLKSSGRASFEAEMLTKTGKTITIIFSAVVSDDTISATILDITERKKAEGDVKASEARYRAFFDQSPFGVVIIDAETALPLEFNDVACRQLGYTREEFATLRVGDYEVKETPEETKRRFAEMLKEGTATFETKHRAKKGEIRDVEISVRTVTLDDKPLFYCIFQDVTGRKKAEEALQSIKWLLKSDTEGENGALTKIGENYEAYYGDLVKLNTEGEIRNSVDKDVLNGIVRDYLDLLGTSSAIYEKNGGYAIGIFSSSWCRFMDAASRKQCGTDDNRDALEHGKWLCHESCWSDASKVSIKTDNPVDIECHGGIRLYAVPIRAGGENIGSINFGYGNPPSDPKELKKIAERYSVDIEEITRYATEYKSRPPFIVELAKKRLQVSANLIGVLVERKRAEVALQRANEELKAAVEMREKTQALMLRQEKLASIGTLSAGVAHEILNPLNIIGTITQVLLMDEWPEKVKENLDEIMTQIRRATKITNNLRMFAHVHKREITAVDVHALFDKTTTLIEHDLNLDNITVERDYDQNLPLVFVDQDLLAQVFLNLLNNARHALQEVKDRKKSISIKTRAFAGTVEIRLSNSGPHIPEDIIGRIFDPFFTTKDPDKGTGLGLSMAHIFIQDFGGSITVQNEAPEGVTFIITLPAKGKE